MPLYRDPVVQMNDRVRETVLLRWPAMLLLASLAVWMVVSVVAADETITLMSQNMERTALVYVPEKATGQDTRMFPLVLAFHGSTWNGSLMRDITGFNDLAEREGFIVAYPNGTGPGDVLSWNAEQCCSFAMAEGVDDIEFVETLIDELVQRYPVDPSRVYACGFSNGAMLVHKLGLALPARFAAIASVGGAMYGDPEPIDVPLPVLIIHGTEDSVVPYDGGWGTLAELSGKTEPGKSVQFAVDFWARSNGCQSFDRKEINRNVVVRHYGDCAGETEVFFYSLIGEEHVWPVLTRHVPDALAGNPDTDLLSLIASPGAGSEGGQPAVSWDLFESGLDASRVMWDFFRQHVRSFEEASG